MKKILIILFSIIVSLGLAFTITWGVINFNKVKDGMSGTGLYTETDLNKAHTDGYNQAIKDKAQYLVLIEEYRNTIATLNDTVSQLKFQVNTLTANNKDYSTQIESLTAYKTSLEEEVVRLENGKANNEEAIYKLNNQIISLNKQISELSDLAQSASSQTTALNNRINDLQASVNYYESFIAQMENGEQVVATYEVDGTVWKIEILNKGSEITFTSPANTETAIFNGWKIDGIDELLGNTYTINANTKFVADITYKHQVTFMIDEQVYDNQYVIENEFATIPELPVKEGYQFLGWSLNGVGIIDEINSLPVTDNIIYVAVFSKIYNVTVEGITTFNIPEHIINEDYTFNDYFLEYYGEIPTVEGFSFYGWSRVDPKSDKFEVVDNTIDIALIYEDTIIYPVYMISAMRHSSKSLSSIPDTEDDIIYSNNISYTITFESLGISIDEILIKKLNYSVILKQVCESNTQSGIPSRDDTKQGSLLGTILSTPYTHNSATISCNEISDGKFAFNASAEYSFTDDGMSLDINYEKVDKFSRVVSASFNISCSYTILYTGNLV